jgi:hypothetical protein
MCPDFPKIATPAQVWAEPTRTITALTGQPRTDLLGEDNTFELGTGTRKAKIDNVDAAITSRSTLTQAQVISDATPFAGARIGTIPAFVAPTEASILMDGTEKTLIEITDVKSSEIEAWADLTPMAAGDTIIVRYSRKMKVAGAYVKYAEETYSGAQSIPALCILNKKVYRSIKITAQQTAIGVYRTIDIQIIRAQEA